MIAAIVVPAGFRSIAMIRACLVSGRIAVFEDEGASLSKDNIRSIFQESLDRSSPGEDAKASALIPARLRANMKYRHPTLASS